MKVFVYGTLRKHEMNSHLLEDCECVAEQAWVYGELFERDLGYPVMRSSVEQRVYGELYSVDEETLMKLDILEDYQAGRTNNLYERVEVSVHTDLGQEIAFVYIDNQPNIADQAIKYGDWKLHNLLTKRPDKLYYFAYGSCMDTERFKQANVEHHFQQVVGVGILDGYTMKYLFPLHDGGRADILEDGGVTEGILYEIPYECKKYLFKREGFYKGWYRATFVDVRIGEQQINNVLTFHVYDKKEEQAPPAHYAAEILRGSKGRVSTHYYKNLVSELRRLGCDYLDEPIY